MYVAIFITIFSTLFFSTILSNHLLTNAIFTMKTNNVNYKKELIKNNFNIIKQNTYLYCKNQNTLPNISDFTFLNNNNLSGNEFNLSFSNKYDTITVSSFVNNEDIAYYENNGFICDSNSCNKDFNISNEITTLYNTKSKCIYENEDYALLDLLKNKCETSIGTDFTGKFIDSEMEDMYRITSIACTDTNDISNDDLNVSFDLLKNNLNSITIKGKSLQNLDFLTNIKLSNNASLDFSSNNISDVSILDKINLDIIFLEHNPLDTMPNDLNASKINLSYSNIDNLTFLNNNDKITDLNISNTSVSDLSPIGNTILNLDLTSTSVSDLSPIGNYPLVSLILNGSQVTDLSPICDNNTLTSFNLDNTVDTKCTTDSNFCNLDIINNDSNFCN